MINIDQSVVLPLNMDPKWDGIKDIPSGGFPAQRPVARSFDVFFDLRLNKRLSKHSRRRLFETLSRPLWRHCIDANLGWDSRTTNIVLTFASLTNVVRIWCYFVYCAIWNGFQWIMLLILNNLGCARFSVYCIHVHRPPKVWHHFG